MPVEVVTEADAAAHGNPYLEETSDSEERRMSKSNMPGGTTFEFFLETICNGNPPGIFLLHYLFLKVEDKLEGENTTLRFVDSWTVFRADAGLAHLALHLRQKWSALFLRRLQSPGKPMTQIDLAVLDAVVFVLTAEEAELGLTQPYGIGQRPKMILGSDNICSSPGKCANIAAFVLP